MKETKHNKTAIREFTSVNEFENYITTSPLNEVFRWEELSSVSGTQSFTKTKSYEEATSLFKNGWDSMAQNITHQLNVKKCQTLDTHVQKVMFDVVGFQASVPRYLQGIPTNMVNKKLVPIKQKVITLNKDISYNAYTSTQDIIDASIQTLQLIKKIEAQGIRVNLNLIFGAKADKNTEVVKIRLKSANERLNISKLAFPLVHPSMLRRLLFRYIEVAPTVTKGFRWGYGYPLDGSQLKAYCKDEYVLPRLFDGDITQINDLATICSITDNIKNGKQDKPKF